MRIGKTPYPRGLGVHAYCKLRFDLAGAYKKFKVDVGLDAAAASGAACAWQVKADGKVLAKGEAKAGAPAKKLALQLNGAKSLELICDFGPDRDDAGDHLDWAGARLVK